MISIIIAVRDDGLRLRRTLQSIARHTFFEAYEVVVVDDGSVDPVERFVGPGFEGICVRLEEPTGCIVAREAGVRAACGDVLVFLDSHMAVAPAWESVLLAKLEACDRQVLVTPDVSILDEASWTPGSPGPHQAYGLDERLELRWTECMDPDGRVAVVGGACVMVARAHYEACGGLDPGLRVWGSEFTDLSMKSYAIGGGCFLERDVNLGHVYSIPFPFALDQSDVVHNKLRVAVRHLPLACVAQLCLNLSSEPGFAGAVSKISDSWSELAADRREQQHAAPGAGMRYAQQFLPGLLGPIAPRWEAVEAFMALLASGAEGEDEAASVESATSSTGPPAESKSA